MSASRTERRVDVAIVGAGPAGLAIAEELARRGAGVVEVLDRELEAGGVPRHCHHTGYGLRDLHRVLTGPDYARRKVDLALTAGAAVRPGVAVTGWAGPLALDLTSPAGLERVSARAIVLATGARERPRAARWVAGDRPSGVLTTGQLQQAIHLYGQSVGQRAIVVGAEHVSYSAVVTLAEAGVEVVAMVTDQPRAQSYLAFRVGAAARWRTPVVTRSRVARVVGRGRVEAVELRRVDRPDDVRRIACDTVVFTGDWIPDHELARSGGLLLDAGTRGPAVDADGRGTTAGVFAVGNLVHPVETADVVAVRARRTAQAVLGQLGDATNAPPDAVPLVAEEPLAWVWPNLWRRDTRQAGPLTVWSRAFVASPTVSVTQSGRVLGRTRLRRTLVPNRPHALPDGWAAQVVPDGGPIVVAVRSGRI